MADSTVVTEKAEEKKEKPLGVEVREKTFQQLLKEQQEARNKPADDTEVKPVIDTKKEDDEKKAKDAEDERVKKEEEEKRQLQEKQDLASKAADEVIKRQEEEKRKEEDKLKAEADAKKREEDLKPAWQKDPNAPKDDKGNPLPRSYDEIQQEAARIAEERAYSRLKAEQARVEQEAAQKNKEKEQSEQQVKEQREKMEKQIQSDIESDLNDLYTSNKLTKIKDPSDPNDPGNKEYRNLFETAQKVNAERMAKGEQPIRSLKLIYYEHYKPLAKPAGHDAPVIGNESTLSKEAPDDKYIPARDRNKSWSQILKEESARLAKGINVRGK